jgi:hypothetical protein
LVPWPWSTTYATDHAAGDYTEANRQTGAVSGSAKMRLEASGTPDAGLAQVYAQVTRGGVAGVNGSGVVYRDDAAETWKGAEVASILTGYQSISTVTAPGGAGGARRCPGAVTLANGTVLVAVTDVDSTPTVRIRVITRSTSGAWTSATVASYLLASTLAEPAACDIVRAPDGALHIYARYSTDRGSTWSVALWRSADDGVTWALQTVSTGITITDEGRWLRAGVLGSGQVIVWTTDDTGTSTDAAQWLSVDGGFTFKFIDGEARCAVWAVANLGGQLVILRESHGSADKFEAVAVGDGASSALTAEALSVVRNSASTPYVGGAALAVEPNGVAWAWVAVTGDLLVYRSTDSGASWVLTEGYQTGGGKSPAQPVAVHVRGEMLTVSCAWNGTAISGGLVEFRWGGRSDVTLDYDPGFNGWDHTFAPVDTITNAGWTATDTGGTRTLAQDTGERWQTAGGESILSSIALGVSAQTVYGRWVVQPVTDTIRMRLYCDYSTIQYGLVINVRPDGIRAYDDTAGPPSFTAGTFTAVVEILAAINHDTAKAAVWWRLRDATGERVWTQITVTGMADTSGTGTTHDVYVGASSEAYIVEAGFGSGISSDLADGVTRPGDLSPVRLSSYVPAYLTGGVSVIGRGVAVVDGSTYTIPVTSLRRKDAMLPTVEPSPARGWRSSGTGTQDLRFTLDSSTGAAVNTGSDVWGIYLDRLVGVSQVELYSGTGAGTLIATADFRVALTYAHSGGAVTPSASGSVTASRWVAADELVGGYFQFANGTVRKIARNTSGSLTWGSTVAENRATLYLEGITGAEDSSGSGYVHLPRALVLWYLRGSRSLTQVRLRVPSSLPVPPEGYRSIGLLAMGPLRLLGRSWDRAEQVETAPNDAIVTQPDGTRRNIQREGVRRRVEVAIVETWLDTADVLGATPSPDYVKVSLNASATPTADAWGDALSLEGLVREVRRDPIVYVPHVPIDAGSGDAVVVHTRRAAHGSIYGRFTSQFRREQLEVGTTITDDGHRVSTISLEEEL